MTTRPGVFTLCSTQLVVGASAQATVKILVDAASQQNGQFLTATLLKSTGYQFVVATNGAAGPIRGAILLTTVNALSTLGAEGYELTVAPDSVVVRAPAQAGVAVSDTVTLSFTNPPPAQPGHFDALSLQPDGSRQMSMSGTAYTNYVLKFTGEWASWLPLTNLSSPSGLFQFNDPAPATNSTRFYRLRVGP
jgi:hypothetical protein